MTPFLHCSRFRRMKRGQPKENSAPHAWLIKSPAASCSSAHTFPITAAAKLGQTGALKHDRALSLETKTLGRCLDSGITAQATEQDGEAPCIRIRGHCMSAYNPGQAIYLLAPRWAPCPQLSTNNDHHVPTSLISTTFSVISTYLKHFMISTFLKPDCSLTIIKSIFQLIGGSTVLS